MVKTDRTVIASFLPALIGGGAEKVTLTLTAGLARAGRKVDFIVGNRVGALANSVPEGCNLIDLGGRRVTRSVIPLARYLRKTRPRAIISQMDFANPLVVLASILSRSGTPVICVEHTPPETMPYNYGFQRWINRIMYPRAAAVVAVSQGVAGSIRKHFGLPGLKVSVIHNGIVDEALMAKSREPVGHPWLASTPAVPLFLAAGRLHRQKGFEYLLEAMAMVLKRREARLIILGEGELHKELNAQTDRLGIRSQVDFGGFQSNPYPFFRAADCFVLSSIFEGLPTVLIEAMACGCKVVSTDCPSGPAEILNQEGLGFLVPPANPAALADAMCAAVDFPFDRDKLRGRANDFSVENCIRNYLNLVDSTGIKT